MLPSTESETHSKESSSASTARTQPWSSLLLFSQFCEREGPSVLFCTECKDVSFLQQDVQASVNSSILSKVEYVTIEYLDEEKKQSSAHSSSDNLIEDGDDECEQDGNFVKRVFVSSHTIKPELSTNFKSLCLRSLSVEYVGPGREGPVLFGDEKQGYSFAYVFKVKDSKARGYARWFSFVLMNSRNVSSLTLSWSFIQKALGQLVKDIKMRAQDVFVQEQQEQEKTNMQMNSVHSGSMSNSVHPGSHQQVPLSSTANARFYSPHMMQGKSGVAPSAALLRQKRSTEPLRSLSKLLQIENFFEQIHTWGASILKAYNERLIEPVVELHTDSPQYSITASTVDPAKHIDSFYEFGNLLKKFYGISQQKVKLSTVEGEDEFVNVEKNDLDGTQDHQTTTTAPSIVASTAASTNFLTVYRNVVRTLIHNILFGNQVIIRCDSLSFGQDIARILMRSIPEPCHKTVDSHKEYKPSYLANFLVITNDVILPENQVDYSYSTLLDIRGDFKKINSLSIRFDGKTKETKIGLELEKLFEGEFLKKKKKKKREEDTPEGLKAIREAEFALIECLKQEWIDKSKLLIRLTRNIPRVPSKSNNLSSASSTSTTSSGMKKSISTTSLSGGSSSSKPKHPQQPSGTAQQDPVAQFQTMFQLSQDDMSVVRYFGTGQLKLMIH